MDDQSRSMVIELRVPLCCVKCEEKVTDGIMLLEGVEEVTCDRTENRVTVKGSANPDKVLKRVRKVKPRAELIRRPLPTLVPRPLPTSVVDDEVLLNQVQEQPKPTFNKPRSKDAEDIGMFRAFYGTLPIDKSCYREIERRSKDDNYPSEAPIILRSLLFSKL
jgi:hypothetical protein